MMSVTVWGTLKVDEFFKDYNWLGLPPRLEATDTTSESLEQPSWLCLSVQQFLNQNNWRGKPNPSSLGRGAEGRHGGAEGRHGGAEGRHGGAAPTLIMPVGQFFQMAVWKGLSQATAGSKPQPQSKLETPVFNSLDYNLSDLSDLF